MITKKYSSKKGSCTVTFTLSSEQVGDKRDVRVLADFNDWSWIDGVAMKASKGKYSGTVELPALPAHYQFRYLVDGSQWMNDPAAEAYLPNVHGTTNCVFEIETVPAEEAPKAKKAAPKAAAPKAAAPKAAAPKAAAPKAGAIKTTEPKAAEPVSAPDDLKKIEGIGPKIADLLNADGITTFAQLAKAPKKQLATILEKAGARFRLAKPDTWQEQAKLAAAGKTDALKKLQDELKGGVRK